MTPSDFLCRFLACDDALGEISDSSDTFNDFDEKVPPLSLSSSSSSEFSEPSSSEASFESGFSASEKTLF